MNCTVLVNYFYFQIYMSSTILQTLTHTLRYSIVRIAYLQIPFGHKLDAGITFRIESWHLRCYPTIISLENVVVDLVVLVVNSHVQGSKNTILQLQ